MKFAVLLQPQSDGSVRAIVPAIPRLFVPRSGRLEALEAARCALLDTITESELVQVDVPEAVAKRNPWLEDFGIFKDDPMWNEFVAEMSAARERDRAAISD